MIIRAFILTILLVWPLQAYAQEKSQLIQDEKVFNAEHFELENGLEIVVIPNHRAPVVTHMVWYRVGAADEAPGKSGIAHFLEHLLFKGSTGLEPGEFSKTIRKLGGNDNAFTSQDYTAYYQSIAVEHLETVMTMEAGRMRGLAPPLAEVESERKVILEERRQRTDNDPRGRFGEQMHAALYVNHPYGTPVIGWFHEMEKLTWDDAKSFYDKWYGPNNAVLVVSGDVTGEQVHKLAKRIYGPLERITLPPRLRTTSPPLHGQPKMILRHEAIRQPVVQRNYRGPSYRQNAKDSLALQVLEEIVGSGSTSRLYKSLVIEQKLTSGAGLSYSGSAWNDGSITIYASPVPGVNLEEVEKAIEEELRKLVKGGVTKEELRDAKTRMQAGAIYARDSLSGPAMVLGRSLVTGSTVDDLEYWPQKIEKVTAAQVQDVAARFLDPDTERDHQPVTGYLLPALTPKIQEEAKTE